MEFYLLNKINDVNKDLIWFKDLSWKDASLVGNKNVNLAELMRIGINVPNGFAISTKVYRRFLIENNMLPVISEYIDYFYNNMNNIETIEKTSVELRKKMEKGSLNDNIKDKIKKFYCQLQENSGVEEKLVSIRSSATFEDSSRASCAGLYETYLNLTEKDLFMKILSCWSSLFTPQAMFYRELHGFSQGNVFMGICVQKMVDAKTAGVLFTANPITGDKKQIVIEANWGLGESVVSGSITPDSYIIDKTRFKVLERKISEKTMQYIYYKKLKSSSYFPVSLKKQKISCLTDDEIIGLSRIALIIESHYSTVQDIEWAIDRLSNDIYILQTRPVTQIKTIQ